MLHILLFILKIIGILLFCILCLLLLCFFCILFVPLRYRIEAVRREGAGEPPAVVTVKVTWFLHFVNVLISFTGSLSVRARILFITIFRLPKRKKRGRTKTGDKERRENKKQPQEASLSETPENEVESGDRAENTAEEKHAEKETVSPGMAEDGETIGEPDKKATLWDKLRAVPKILCLIFEKIRSILKNIQYTIQNICDKIRSVSDNIEYYRDVIEGEAFQRSYTLCKKELMSIARGLKPDKFETALVVGMDDPAATGNILAVCGMLYPIFGPNINVTGDFDRKRLEGRVFIKGKLRLFTFIRSAVRVYFSKDIRKLYGLLKKEAV